ncbi:LysE family translocator [Nocardioides zeicaulis]|uniref:LysE family translocator n=1 Tax=Nocardioides zeicaulis TaxID=1776857 RepID=A0ABV6DWW4_9ACTN
MDISTFAAFWAVSILFVITPGADWAYAITAGLRHRSIGPAIAGLLAGHVIATLAVAAGVAALLAGSPTVLMAMTISGAAYLVWLGVGMLRSPDVGTTQEPEPVGVASSAAQSATNRSAAQSLTNGAATSFGHLPADGMHDGSSCGAEGWMPQAARGLGVSGLNPKVFLLFLALLPQFIDPDEAWPVACQIVALGLVHVASCALVYSLVATSARKMLRARPGAARAVTRVSGAAMVVIGAVLVVEQLFR